MTRVSTNAYISASHRAASALRAVRAQPGWITRLAILTFLIVIALPLLALIVFAAIVAVVVFAVLALWHALLGRARGLLPRRDGRTNVRVIPRAQR